MLLGKSKTKYIQVHSVDRCRKMVSFPEQIYTQTYLTKFVVGKSHVFETECLDLND